MPDPNVSPISQLLFSLGMTREDLNKRSNEMRQFLTANDPILAPASEAPSSYRSASSSERPLSTRPASSSLASSRSMSRTSSHSRREPSPPTTPIKSEQTEAVLPGRPMDSMEIIIERQRRTRRERRTRKEREAAAGGKVFAPPPSPSPSSTSQSAVSLDSFMQSRDDRPPSIVGSELASSSTSSEEVDPAPVTPQKSRYYREHTMSMSKSSSRKSTACKTETPTPTKPSAQQSSQSHTQPTFYPFPPFATYGQYMPVHYPVPQPSTSALPVTPQTYRTISSSNVGRSERANRSPLPSSSPMMAYSSPPPSSPVGRIVNLVSSPGPMGSSPAKDQYDHLPFKLPPGPYSPKKPELSYAALVGRAILSSAEHRLTLQEIYDYITIVFPHYKRGETTWMNSIRHVLSTTACFRKVPRDRSIGRTLWAIHDEDLECFAGGGFKKTLCKDIMKQQAEKDKGKVKARKRVELEDDGITEVRKAKRSRKDSSYKLSSSSHHSSEMTLSQLPVLNHKPSFLSASSSHSFFPRPTPHHQPYYESCLPKPQLLPAEVIFPPLPPSAALASRPMSRPTSRIVAKAAPLSPPLKKERNASVSKAEFSEPSSSSSVPELSPNRSSSNSPPSSNLATSDMDIETPPIATIEDEKLAEKAGGIVVAGVNGGVDDEDQSAFGMDDDNVFNSSLLGPVQFWGESPRSVDFLQPGIELLNFDAMTDDEEEEEEEEEPEIELSKSSKARLAHRRNLFPTTPGSPTLGLRSLKKSSSSSVPMLTAKRVERPKTPPAASSSSASYEAPMTPPRRTLKLSSVRTPISHKGLHMSPSASLAHYKSNLDPPRHERIEAPPLLFPSAMKPPEPDVSSSSYSDDPFDPMRTPKRLNHGSHNGPGPSTTLASLAPATPKRGSGSGSGFHDSLFRTPVGFSPFRTPRSRAQIHDPNDPRVLLDEELNRPSLTDDSPGGIFGKTSRGLLYDSPGFDTWGSSPGKKYWW